MAISRSTPKKAPSQNPVNFYECQQHGGADGRATPQRVGDKLASGTMREKIFGRKDLSK